MLNRKIAYIDLTNKTVRMETIPIEWRRKYLGARGINNFLQWSLTDANTDPLSPEAPLLVGAGWMTGVPGFGTGRVNIAGLSPEAESIGCSNIGGYFGPEMRYAGFDHLVITGKSETPVYLMITDDNIEILDADYLWGLNTWETQQAIRRHHDDPEIRSLVIGPAGENLVKMANVITGLKNASGRCGLGCLMGDKKLKAIAARGTGDIKLAYPEELLSWIKEQQDALLSRKWTKALGRFGTPLLYTVSNQGGWALSQKTGAPLGKAGEAISADKIEPYSLGMAACYGCAVHCRHRHYISEGKYAGTLGEGPEYLGIEGFGATNELLNIEHIMVMFDQCNRLGINAAVNRIIGWVQFLLMKGIITEKDIGYYVDWGDADAVSRLIDDIAYRRTPFGNILAEGVNAVKYLPPEAAPHLAVIKNVVASPIANAGVKSFAFATVVGTLPGHAHRNRPGLDVLGLPEDYLKEIYGGPVSGNFRSYDGKSRMVWWHEMLYVICDSLGCCRFQTVFNSPHAPKYEEYKELIRLTTGLDFSIDELKDISNRVDSIERLILGEHGHGTRETDKLPEKWLNREITDGPLKGETLDLDKFEQFLDEYFELHGWDSNGVPTKQTIKRLGIAKAKGLLKEVHLGKEGKHS